MKAFFALAALTALVAVRAAEDDYEFENNVLVLNDENFEQGIKEFDPLLVAFVAPWCGHCKKLKPEMEKAAKALKAEGIKIAKVDADAHKDLARKFDISGFPTLKYFRNSKALEYNGGRDKDAIMSWLRKRSGPAVTTINTVAEADAFKAKGDVVVLCFAEAGSDAAKACEAAAGSNDDVPFGITNAADVRAKYNVGATEVTAVALNEFEGQDNESKINVDAAAWTADSDVLSKWASANSLPLVITFSQEIAPKIFRGDIKTHFLLFADAEDDGAGAAALKAFRGVAKDNQGAFLFVNVPPSEDRVMSYFGFDKAALPAAVIVDMSEGGMKKFIYAEKTYEASNLQSFITEYKAGNIKPTLKSDPVVPADEQAKNAVKVVVGKSFEDLCLDKTKDCLLEVYAPWCGHCKNLAPIYEKLGQAVEKAGLSDIVIAKMDGTTNEVDYPGLNIKGYPTIVFLPAGEKKVVEYDGSRDLSGFVSFLKKNAKSAKGAKGLDGAAEAVEDNEDDGEL